MKTILLVCTGNLCRSPMAAAILEQRLATLGLAGEVQVASAGIRARTGDPASAPAIGLLNERGLALDQHRSQPVTEAILDHASLVVVMEEAQRKFLFYLSMKNLNKVFLLSELSGGHEDLADPYGGTREDYIRTADQITALLDAGMPRIVKFLKLQPTPGL